MALLNKLLKHFIPSKMILQQLPAGNKKSVLLTFDDGPHPESTPLVLDLLDKFDAKAFFFVVGERVEERPDLARDIISRGHLIGNHTFSNYKKESLCIEFIKQIQYQGRAFRMWAVIKGEEN